MSLSPEQQLHNDQQVNKIWYHRSMVPDAPLHLQKLVERANEEALDGAFYVCAFLATGLQCPHGCTGKNKVPTCPAQVTDACYNVFTGHLCINPGACYCPTLCPMFLKGLPCKGQCVHAHLDGNGQFRSKGHCKFHLDGKCHKGEDCEYTHLPNPSVNDPDRCFTVDEWVAAKASMATPQCRNGNKCYYAACTASHPENWVRPAVSGPPCRNGIKCHFSACKAVHPEGWVRPTIE